MEYSFCESAHASPFSKWHIRKLTKAGKKLGGGADTDSLCDKKVNWDLEVQLDKHHLENNSCKKCLEIYLSNLGRVIWKY